MVLLLVCGGPVPSADDAVLSHSYWLIIFNQPAACNSNPCSAADLTNPATEAGVCHLAGPVRSGSRMTGRLAAYTGYGCLPGFGGAGFGAAGLTDVAAAELQLLVLEHSGQPDLVDELEDARALFMGACDPGCGVAQLSVHQPAAADSNGLSLSPVVRLGDGASVAGAVSLLVREEGGVRVVIDTQAEAPTQPGPTSRLNQADSVQGSITQTLTGTANLRLSGLNPAIVQSGSSAWTLDKQGELDALGSTVTWTLSAEEIATVSGQLQISGQLILENTGSGPATVGNIVVSLQKKVAKKWVTQSSDVADATDGDAATTAKIYAAASSENKSSFTENSASGALEFMDATNNTLFSLVPQVLIGSGQTRTLLFSASFNNNDAALKLLPGTQIRAEVIVTFGNATTSGNSTANVDINGNGTLDADEARVRSVPSRLTVTVPAAVNGNGTVTLSDTLADIATTGTVTFQNAQFNLGATTGTVTATVAGGASGGTITNCAHLTSAGQTTNVGGSTFPLVAALDLEDCSTVDVGAVTTCQPGQAGCGWHAGDLVTYAQGQYGGTPGSASGATLLAAQYNGVYAGLFEVGRPGTTGFSLVFTTASAMFAYLPATGTPAALNADLLNTTSSASGQFGGDVAALKLNVDFSDLDVLGGSADLRIGDLSLCGLANGSLNNISVRTFLGMANTALGGGSTGIAISELDTLTRDINTSFEGGAVSAFAADHLVNGSCP